MFFDVLGKYWKSGRAVYCSGLENRRPVGAGPWVRILPLPLTVHWCSGNISGCLPDATGSIPVWTAIRVYGIDG